MNLFSTLRVGCNDSLHSSSNCCSVVIGYFYLTHTHTHTHKEKKKKSE